MPTYVALAMLNLVLVTVYHPGERGRILRDTGLPSFPLELLSGLMAGATVLVYAHAGLTAAAALLVVLVITIPLVRSVGDALMRADDLVALRHVSDERAAEVARLSSDRERLLSEVLDAEQRERARLAESLHDGPMQRLVALRQDAAERDDETAHRLDAAIRETRAIISSFHPATVRELGFEASLRAAVAPFPAAQSVRLTVDSAVDDRGAGGHAAGADRPGAGRERRQARQPDRDPRRGRVPRTVGSCSTSTTTVSASTMRRAAAPYRPAISASRWSAAESRTSAGASRSPPALTAGPTRVSSSRRSAVDWTNIRGRKMREWPRSKRPEPFVGRMFYYVLDAPPPNLLLVTEANTPKRGGSRNRGGRRETWVGRSESLTDFLT